MEDALIVVMVEALDVVFEDNIEDDFVVERDNDEDLLVGLAFDETIHFLRELEYPCFTEYTEPSGVVISSTPTIEVLPPEV